MIAPDPNAIDEILQAKTFADFENIVRNQPFSGTAYSEYRQISLTSDLITNPNVPQDVKDAVIYAENALTQGFSQNGQSQGAGIRANNIVAMIIHQIYLENYPDILDVVAKGEFISSGFQHYLAFGAAEGRTLFDNEAYMDRYPDVRTAVEAGAIPNAFAHYLVSGLVEGRENPTSSLHFDEEVYLLTNPDVASAVNAGTYSSGLEHYLFAGKKEGREVFNEGDYLAANTDVYNAVMNGSFSSGREHYVLFGRAEGRPLS